MVISMAIASAAIGVARPAAGLWGGWAAFSVGAVNALAITLLAIGPGNLFPIVIIIGSGLVVRPAFAGSVAAALTTWTVRLLIAATGRTTARRR
jgi:hypothetical protein